MSQDTSVETAERSIEPFPLKGLAYCVKITVLRQDMRRDTTNRLGSWDCSVPRVRTYVSRHCEGRLRQSKLGTWQNEPRHESRDGREEHRAIASQDSFYTLDATLLVPKMGALIVHSTKVAHSTSRRVLDFGRKGRSAGAHCSAICQARALSCCHTSTHPPPPMYCVHFPSREPTARPFLPLFYSHRTALLSCAFRMG
jgi:hypothetical protein